MNQKKRESTDVDFLKWNMSVPYRGREKENHPVVIIM